MEIRVICAGFVIVTLCAIANGYGLRVLDSPNDQYQGVTYQRKTRSPVVYVADENDQRVVIITIKKPNSNSFNNNQNQDQNLGSLQPSQLPGAQTIIELLRKLGIPGLPEPTPTFPQVFGGYGGGIGGATNLGAGQGPAATGEFGADLAGGVVGGGFGRNKPTADKSNNSR